jgi:hypothetical protein
LISTQRACRLMRLERSSYYYRVHPRDNRAVTVAIERTGRGARALWLPGD